MEKHCKAKNRIDIFKLEWQTYLLKSDIFEKTLLNMH